MNFTVGFGLGVNIGGRGLELLELLTSAGGLFGGLRHGAVGKPHVVELDTPEAFWNQWRCGRHDLGRRVQQFEDALAGGHRRLQDVVLLAEVLDGAEEALRVLHEGHQDSEGDGIADDLVSAEPHHARDGGGRQDFHYRVINGVGQDGVLVGVHVGAIDLFEVLVGLLLAVEELQDDDSGDVFLQVGIDPGDGDTNTPVTLAHRLAKQAGGKENDRQNSERNQRQTPAHVEHDGDDAGQHEDVFEDGDHAGGEHFVQRVHIAGDTRDQAADGISVEERDVQPLQMAEDLRPQIEHHLLPRPLHDVGLGEFEQEADQQESNVDCRNLRDAHQGLAAEEAIEQRMRLGAAGEIFIDRNLGQVGANDVGAGLEDDGDEGNHDLQPVGTQILKQALHQPAVIRFA